MKKLVVLTVLVFILLVASLSAQETRSATKYEEWSIMTKIEKLAYVEAIADTWSMAYYVLVNMEAPEECSSFFEMVYEKSLTGITLGLMIAIVDDYYTTPDNRGDPVIVALLKSRAR